jgi:hypothetical protein
MLKTRPRIRWFAVVGLTIGATCAGGCTRTPYVIGAVCPMGDGGSPIDAACPGAPDGGGGGETGDGPGNATFAADLDRSGAMILGPLGLPGGSTPATLTLRGERATSGGWLSDEGAVLAGGAATPLPGTPAPFTDGTLAVSLTAGGPGYVASSPDPGAVGAGDFVVEIVMNAGPGATIADKRAPTGAGWGVRTDASTLVLSVGDGDPTHLTEASAPIAAAAWHHCLAWVSHAAGARVDCNGRQGALVPIKAAGTLDVVTPLSIGGGGPARVARLAMTVVMPGGLGDPSGWLALGRRRFAALTGALPRVHMGADLPRAGLRDSPAYLDLQAAAGSARGLFLVGPDWPRVACRTDSAGAYDCGFLSEPLRTRRVPGDARSWARSELATTATNAALPAEGPPLVDLVPTATDAPHVLSAMAPDTAAKQVFSFFARAGTVDRVGVRVGALDLAVYDLRAGTIIGQPPAGVRATIEDWGGGLRRCIYAYTGVAGDVSHSLTLLDATGAAAFAGDGVTPAISVAGLQIDLGLVLAGSLLAADTQPADHLTFEGADGNLPSVAGAAIDVRVLLPEGPRLTDQAIFNLNRGTAFADQVQLFVRGDQGLAEFWGISAAKTYWTFDNPTTVIDGKRHVMRAWWGLTSAHISVDGITNDQTVLLPDPPPFVLDRIDVGFSEKSGGPLEGLVAGLSIGTP